MFDLRHPAARAVFTGALLIIGGFLFFLAWELTEKHPIVDLSLFKSRSSIEMCRNCSEGSPVWA